MSDEKRLSFLAQKRADYAKSKEAGWAARAVERSIREPFRHQAWSLYRNMLMRVREKGWPRPDFNAAWIEEQMRARPTCECCGVDFHIGRKDGRFTNASPSIDRRDNLKHYAKDNVALICWRCNNIKRDYTADDLYVVARWLERRIVA